MRVSLGLVETPRVFEFLDQRLVGISHEFARMRAGGESALGIDGVRRGQTIFPSDFPVYFAKCRSQVNESCALVHGDKGCVNHRVCRRMLLGQVVKRPYVGSGKIRPRNSSRVWKSSPRTDGASDLATM